MLLVVLLILIPLCIAKKDSRLHLLTGTAVIVYLFLYNNYIEHYNVAINNLIQGKLQDATIINLPKDLLNKLQNPIYVEEIKLLKNNCDLNKYITSNYDTSKIHNPWTYHSNYINIDSLEFLTSTNLFNQFNLKLDILTTDDKCVKFKINNNKCHIYSYNNNIKKLIKNEWYEISIYCANKSQTKLSICPYLATSLTSDESSNLSYDFMNYDYKMVSIKDGFIKLTWTINYKSKEDMTSINFLINNSNDNICIIYNPEIRHITDIDSYLTKVDVEPISEEINEPISEEIDEIDINKHLNIISTEESEFNMDKLLSLISTLYIDNNNNPDLYKEYAELLKIKLTTIKKSELRQFLLEVTENVQNYEKTVRRIISYIIVTFNKINHLNVSESYSIKEIEKLIVDVIKTKFKKIDIYNSNNIKQFNNLIKESFNIYNTQTNDENILTTKFKLIIDKYVNIFENSIPYINYSNIFQLIEKSILYDDSMWNLSNNLDSIPYNNWKNLLQNTTNKNIKSRLLKNDIYSKYGDLYELDDFIFNHIFFIISIIIDIVNRFNELNNTGIKRLPNVISFDLSEQNTKFNNKLIKDVNKLIIKLLKKYLSTKALKVIETNRNEILNIDVPISKDDELLKVDTSVFETSKPLTTPLLNKISTDSSNLNIDDEDDILPSTGLTSTTSPFSILPSISNPTTRQTNSNIIVDEKSLFTIDKSNMLLSTCNTLDQ